MKNFSLILLVALLSSSAFMVSTPQVAHADHPPETRNTTGVQIPLMIWNRTYGGAYKDVAYSIVQTLDGSYVMAGTTEFSSANAEIWLMRIGISGDVIWDRTFKIGGNSYARKMIQTSDGGFAVVGFSSYNALFIKTNATGHPQWGNTYGDGQLYSIYETLDGGYIMAGFVITTIRDFLLIKTDATGNMQWRTTYGGANIDYAEAVVQCDDGGYAIAGHTSSYGTGNGDYWLIKTNATGAIEWDRTYGGSQRESSVRSIIKSSDSAYVMVGDTLSFGSGGYSSWVVKVDYGGNMILNETYGGSYDESSQQLTETNDGGYLVVGSTYSSETGSFDMWLVKADSDLEMQWTQTYGGPGSDIGFSAAQTSDLGYVLAGTWAETPSFTGDSWLIRLATSEMPIIPKLETVGRHVVDEYGKPVNLYGVNKPGLAWADYADGKWKVWKPRFNAASDVWHDVLDENDWIQIKNWGCNIIRLGFTQEMWETSLDYRVAIDQAVEYGRSHGIYTVLDNHWTTDEDEWVQTGVPSDWSSWKSMWESIATRYAGNTSVLFDIWNEPHSGTLWTQSWENWRYHAQQCVDRIRNAGFEGIILVSGIDWGRNASEIVENPIIDDNVAYTLHWYVHEETQRTESEIEAWLDDKGWKSIIESNLAPVITGEFNVYNETEALDNTEEIWMRNFCTVMRRWNIHFVGWGWYPQEWNPELSSNPSADFWAWALLSENDIQSGEAEWYVPSHGGEILIDEIHNAQLSRERGDVDCDSDVDIFDMVHMALRYGSNPSDSSYDSNCDVDNDGDVDIFDIVIAASHYGESW